MLADIPANGLALPYIVFFVTIKALLTRIHVVDHCASLTTACTVLASKTIPCTGQIVANMGPIGTLLVGGEVSTNCGGTSLTAHSDEISAVIDRGTVAGDLHGLRNRALSNCRISQAFTCHLAAPM
jgi:hypothetical protein